MADNNGFNNLDFLKGGRPWMQIAPWEPAEAATEFVGLGHLQVDNIEDDKAVKKIEPPTILWPAGVMYTGRTFKIVGSLWQADLDKRRLVAGDVPDVITLNDEDGQPTRKYLIGTEHDDEVPMYSVILTIPRLAMQPLGSSGPTYITRTLYIHNAYFDPKVKESHKKGDVSIMPFTLEAIWDDTVDGDNGNVAYYLDEAAIATP